MTPGDEALIGKIAARWYEWLGATLGTPDDLIDEAERALRRWRSYERRHPKARGTREERVLDLAKGLFDPVEPAGWNKSDMTDLADALVAVLDSPVETS